jgi:predicted ATP-binding protein involved in virulence
MELDRARGDPAAEWFLHRWKTAFEQLTDRPWQHQLAAWPFRRYGPSLMGQMSLLSSGELDVLVTVAAVLSQKICLVRKRPSVAWDADGPGGIVFIDEIDAHLHPQWQQRVVPLLADLFPDVTFVFTTHSPFVLRSLKKSNSVVLRFPDGELFSTDFDAWQTDDILDVVFDTKSPWSAGISARLRNLENACRDPDSIDEAVSIYRELTSYDSAGLNAECRRITALHAAPMFLERISGERHEPS